MAEIKYLDDTGLGHLVDKIKEALDGKQPKGNYAQIVNGKIETQVLPFSVSDVLEFSMPDKRLKKLNISAAGWTKIIYDSDTKRFYATQGVEEDDDTARSEERRVGKECRSRW